MNGSDHFGFNANLIQPTHLIALMKMSDIVFELELMKDTFT